MHEPTRRRRRTVILSSAPAAALLITTMIATATGSPATGSPGTTSIDTTTATTRTLSATLTTDGVVENAASSTIVYGRTSAVPNDTDAGGTGGGGTTAQAGTAQPAAHTPDPDSSSDLSQDIELVGYIEPTASGEPVETPLPATTPTADPTKAPSPSPTEPTPDPTTPPAPTKPVPTTPAPTKPAPTKPAPSKPVPTKPAPSKPAPAKPVAPAPETPNRPPSGGISPQQPSGGATASGGGLGQAGAQAGGQQAVEPAKTLTGQADLGSTITTGTKLYTVDGEPVVAVVAETPSWRTLKKGVSDGGDVRTLEQALTTLGYGENLTVDRNFTSATADAVEEWEEALHREDPDGEVDPTEIVMISENSQVVNHALAVGDPISQGSQVLTLASTQRVITASIAAEDINAWGKDATVTVRWADGATFTGRISAVSRDITNTGDDVTNATTDVTIVPTKGTIDHHTGTSADIELVTQQIDEAVTVPVTALHDGPGSKPSVTVLKNGVATERPVTVGLVTQGWAQVTTGLQSGETVRLPGSGSPDPDDT